MKKLVKFDIVHPNPWLIKKLRENPRTQEMSLSDYRDWLNQLASNYSDFYTHYLNTTGEWRAEEYYLHDSLFRRKVVQFLYGPRLGKWIDRLGNKVFDKILKNRFGNWRRYVARKYVEHQQPDVIFARSQPFPSSFYRHFRDRALIIGRLSARLPQNWHPNDFDILYTDWELYRRLFELHGVKTIISPQGFDPRILERIATRKSDPGVIFCGGMGTENFLARTNFFEKIAQSTKFTWWGYWWGNSPDNRSLEDFPNLAAAFRGPISGIEMFQAYRDATICLNNYVDVAGGFGANQRFFEVLGSGGFLLTKAAPNFADHFPAGCFATYTTEEDCLAKIAYYLDRPEERAEIARRGQAFVLEHYSYRDIALQMSDDLLNELTRRNPRHRR